MRMSLAIVVVIVAAALTGCQKSSTEKSGDQFQQKIVELSGNSATDCGHLSTQSPDQLKTASDCAMQAAQNRRPFHVAYQMPGLTVGLAGNSDGKLYYLQAQEPGDNKAGSKPEINVEPCPAVLRIAQSGRVTCVVPGSMGMGTSPHGGMSMPSGMENPHGGMEMPPADTPNPHKGTTPKTKPMSSH